MKPRLVSNNLSTLHSTWLAELVSEYFELVDYDPDQQYLSHDCWLSTELDSAAQQWRDRGGKTVIDRLWEKAQSVPGCYTLSHPAWFWYQESLWYRHLGYDQYQPCRDPQYLALMPMRVQKPHRDYMLAQLGSTVDQFVWSYQALGRNLPQDRDWDSQRYFNPVWYDQTQFSVVLESSVHTRAELPFVTEKTFKPIAFQHPFLVLGCCNTLSYLRSLGFETWENIWDQSYDDIDNWQLRCYNIVQQIHCGSVVLDSVTLKKLQHNRDHFFDRQLVENSIRQQILEPLLNYAETR